MHFRHGVYVAVQRREDLLAPQIKPTYSRRLFQMRTTIRSFYSRPMEVLSYYIPLLVFAATRKLIPPLLTKWTSSLTRNSQTPLDEAKLINENEEGDNSPLAAAALEYKSRVCNCKLIKTLGIRDFTLGVQG